MHSHPLCVSVRVLTAGVYEAALLLLLPVFESHLTAILTSLTVTMVRDIFCTQISKKSDQPMTKG